MTITSGGAVERDRVPPSIESLLSPYGVMSHVGRWTPPRGLWRVNVYASDIGSGRPGHGAAGRATRGCGRVVDDPELARIVAIAEGAERYVGSDVHDDMVVATVAELSGAVVDGERIPRCSTDELARAGCPLVPFDPTIPIRWVEGVDLVSNEKTWVPAVMARYGLPGTLPGENFWVRLSTGHAVHFDPRKALLGAILEVVERDVIALLWLARIPLPLVSEASRSDTIDYLLDWSRRNFIETYLFDATTDLQVPTVYCLQIAPNDRLARQVVGCATGHTMIEAAEKALMEALTSRGIFYDDSPIPDRLEDFHFMEGPRYMGHPDRAAAFDFLIDGCQHRSAPPRASLPSDPGDALSRVVATLAEKDMQVVAVDRTTDELAQVGLVAFSVVIPDLQPMSLVPLAQYKAHPRLYRAPVAMGFRSVPEANLNPWPQPFP